jgi:hypothetical protein
MVIRLIGDKGMLGTEFAYALASSRHEFMGAEREPDIFEFLIR